MECFDIVFFSIIRRKFHGKGIKLKTFRRGYVISRRGVVVRYSRVKPKMLGSSFSINICLNNCYLMRWNKQQDKYSVSREKIAY